MPSFFLRPAGQAVVRRVAPGVAGGTRLRRLLLLGDKVLLVVATPIEY